MSLILLLSLLSAGVLAAQTAVGEVYLISEDTVEFPGWPLAPDEISIQFVSASEGTATLSLTEVDPGYHVIVYQDNLWLDSYSGTTASDVVEFPVQEGSEYLVYLSAVLYDSPAMDSWACVGGTLTYKFTSTAPVSDVVKLPPEDPRQIVEAAYALEEGRSLPYDATLTGTIISIDTPWNQEYCNITVTMLVEGKTIRCYRLAGEGASELTLNDTITVTGRLTNYYSTIEFEQGCTLNAVEKGDYVAPVPPEDPKQIVDEAYGLAPGAVLPYEATLTGKITEILDPYSDEWRNITVILAVEGRENKPILCYRLKGQGADRLKVGDIITVTGNLKNYTKTDVDTGDTTNTIEFTPCNLDAIVSMDNPDWHGPDSLALVGSGLPGIRTWEPADPAGDMIEVAENVYEKLLNCPAETAMNFKIAGNDCWDDRWNFGHTSLVLGQKVPLRCAGDSTDMQLFVEEACTLRFTVDLNPMITGGNATLLVEKVAPVVFRVVGNADWMGSWCSDSDAGLMTQIRSGVYQKRFSNVTPGSYEFRITKNGTWDESWGNGISNYTIYVPKTCDVTVTFTYHGGEGTVQVEYNTLRMGDVTGDGKLNMGDVAMVFAHVRDTTPIIDETALACADVNGDGRINVGDVAAIYAQIREEGPMVIVDEAYALGENEEMADDSTLPGRVISIIEPFHGRYGCITVMMAVEGRENNPILCSRLMGDDAARIGVGDKITVSGRLRNFYGTVEFKEGCRLIKWEDVPNPQETTMAQIVDMAYALNENQELAYDVSLTGRVVALREAYHPEYDNISVVIKISGRESKPVLLYRLEGDGVERIAVGDTVTAIGRLRNFRGEVEMVNCTMTGLVTAGGTVIQQETDPAKILEAAAKLNDYEVLPYTVTLSGTILSIDQIYDAQYQNISVTMFVDGANQPLKIYRLKGENVDRLAVNDTITVTGKIQMYYGSLELVNGTMTRWTSGGGIPPVEETESAAIVDAAYALGEGERLPYEVALTGKIAKLKSPYDPQFMNMTVVMAVEGREDYPIDCFRMKGADNNLCVGDTITVTGILTNYNGIIEFQNGCWMTDWISGDVTKPSDPKKIVDAAFALGENEVLPYFATLTGVVKTIDTPYSDMYRNITVTMTVQGTDGPKDILCYRMKGDLAANVAVGDTITVTGAIKRYVRDKDGVHEDRVEFDSGCTLESMKR